MSREGYSNRTLRDCGKISLSRLGPMPGIPLALVVVFFPPDVLPFASKAYMIKSQLILITTSILFSLSLPSCMYFSQRKVPDCEDVLDFSIERNTDEEWQNKVIINLIFKNKLLYDPVLFNKSTCLFLSEFGIMISIKDEEGNELKESYLLRIECNSRDFVMLYPQQMLSFSFLIDLRDLYSLTEGRYTVQIEYHNYINAKEKGVTACQGTLLSNQLIIDVD